MHTVTIRDFPYNDSPSVVITIPNNKYRLSASNFNEFVKANNNYLFEIITNITSSPTTHNQFVRFFTSLYELITIHNVLPIITEHGVAYSYSTTSILMDYLIKRLYSNDYSPYIREGVWNTQLGLSSEAIASIMLSNSPSSIANKITPMYTSKYNKVNYSEEPSNTEEKVVNTVELAILLATSRLKEQGLVIEKEKEKFTRIVNDYTYLIDKCVSTKDDDSHAKEEKHEDVVTGVDIEGTPLKFDELVGALKQSHIVSRKSYIVPKPHKYTYNSDATYTTQDEII
jgi:hypothetical protein